MNGVIDPYVVMKLKELEEKYPGKEEFSFSSLKKILRRSQEGLENDPSLRKKLYKRGKATKRAKTRYISKTDLAKYMVGK